MSAKAIVMARYPEAEALFVPKEWFRPCELWPNGVPDHWSIFDADREMLGTGNTEDAAWSNAVEKTNAAFKTGH